MDNRIGHLVVWPERCRGCQSCQLACSFAKAGVFNPARSMIVMERDVETEHTAPLFKPIGCDLCGGDPACVKACKYKAITYEPQDNGYKILVKQRKGASE